MYQYQFLQKPLLGPKQNVYHWSLSVLFGRHYTVACLEGLNLVGKFSGRVTWEKSEIREDPGNEVEGLEPLNSTFLLGLPER